MLILSVPFYDFPSSPILIIGAIGIVVALAVFFLAYKKYFNSPFNRELQLKKKALLKEKTELNKKLEKIEQDLKKFIVKAMNIDIFLISFFTYLLIPVVMIAKGKKATN
jgi:hypothetical protein